MVLFPLFKVNIKQILELNSIEQYIKNSFEITEMAWKKISPINYLAIFCPSLVFCGMDEAINSAKSFKDL